MQMKEPLIKDLKRLILDLRISMQLKCGKEVAVVLQLLMQKGRRCKCQLELTQCKLVMKHAIKNLGAQPLLLKMMELNVRCMEMDV
jgi:hypothetical protein